MKEKRVWWLLLLGLTLTFCSSCYSVNAFQSDELLVDDEEFGIEGAPPRHQHPNPDSDPSSVTAATTTTTSSGSRRKKYSGDSADSDFSSSSSSKIQFPLHHAFGDSLFSPAATFSARLKSLNHGALTLTKLRFSRNAMSDVEKQRFQKLLEEDDFYQIRLPSNVLAPPGRDFVVSSVKARCLAREEGLDEHIVIHMDGANVIAVNYGASGTCPYPRLKKLPGKWSFNSHATLKNTDLAPRAPIFSVDALGEENPEGEGVQPPERSFWAKYWMYLIPLGLIVMNAMTQAMNMPEEQAGGQSGAQQAAVQRRQR